MTSSGSARLNARRSATCLPCGSITVSRWPLSRVNATPERGGISYRTRGLIPWAKRAHPGRIERTSAVLARLGRLAVRRQHGISRTRKPNVALQNAFAQLTIAAVRPKLLELIVKVEHERRGLEPARLAAGVRVQPDDEKSLPAEAERKVGVVRVGPDPRIIGQPQPGVLVGQRLDACPEVALEVGLGQARWRLEDDGEAAKQVGLAFVAAHEGKQRRVD